MGTPKDDHVCRYRPILLLYDYHYSIKIQRKAGLPSRQTSGIWIRRVLLPLLHILWNRVSRYGLTDYPHLHSVPNHVTGVPWLYPTEINSLSMRTKGAALGTATNWIVNFMVVEITPIGIQSIHWKFYVIWTVFNFSFIPLTYFFYPETADRTLEDIDRMFRDNQSILVFRDKDMTSSKRPQKYIDHTEREIRRNSSVVTSGADAETRRAMIDRVNREIEEEKAAEMEDQDGKGRASHEEKV